MQEAKVMENQELSPALKAEESLRKRYHKDIFSKFTKAIKEYEL